MKPRSLRVVLTLSLVALSLGATVSLAWADAYYHSEHLPLMPVGDAPLRSGFVENIHANGPQIFALEQYQLNGALPETTFEVWGMIYAGAGGTCAGPLIVPLLDATLVTNGAGNAQGSAVITPEFVPEPLHGQWIDARWEVRAGGAVVYQTECTAVHLD